MDRNTIIDRTLYRKIKGMSRQEIDGLLNKMFEIGVEEAADELFKRTSSAIKDIPGIGEKRYAQVINAIQPIFDDLKTNKK